MAAAASIIQSSTRFFAPSNRSSAHSSICIPETSNSSAFANFEGLRTAPFSKNETRIAIPVRSIQQLTKITRCIAEPIEKTSYTTQVKRNTNIAKLQAGYLFPEIARRRNAHLQKNPEAKIISLGIGDTTEPIPTVITDAMVKRAEGLSSPSGYSGYGAEQGEKAIRSAIAEKFYGGFGIKDSDVFVSDGAKCDIARLQLVFGPDATMACQDPSYPAYVDTSVMMGQTENFDSQSQQYKNIVYMKCTPENDFFPDLENSPRTDIIFFCSPNNPTGIISLLLPFLLFLLLPFLFFLNFSFLFLLIYPYHCPQPHPYHHSHASHSSKSYSIILIFHHIPPSQSSTSSRPSPFITTLLLHHNHSPSS